METSCGQAKLPVILSMPGSRVGRSVAMLSAHELPSFIGRSMLPCWKRFLRRLHLRLLAACRSPDRCIHRMRERLMRSAIPFFPFHFHTAYQRFCTIPAGEGNGSCPRESPRKPRDDTEQIGNELFAWRTLRNRSVWRVKFPSCSCLALETWAEMTQRSRIPPALRRWSIASTGIRR